ncbi:hypothetical protein F7725_017425 [Dissostichus mawsoni]|uniref:Uncharacterized protein n=1 Tax=Dissostichus mawsoni TaxID=36200 RepID=A0A7J5Z4E0_DISMA|nr:hypothetical protein F7725_017425 [Dissostichus mawsoni]
MMSPGRRPSANEPAAFVTIRVSTPNSLKTRTGNVLPENQPPCVTLHCSTEWGFSCVVRLPGPKDIHAEFQRITTIPLETAFMAQLDSHLPQLTSVFQKKGGVVGQKLAKHLAILQKDIEVDDVTRDLQKSTMGIYVINKEGGEPGHYDDVGIFVEGLIILDNIGSVARACAIMLGVIYTLNMAYPKEQASSQPASLLLSPDHLQCWTLSPLLLALLPALSNLVRPPFPSPLDSV